MIWNLKSGSRRYGLRFESKVIILVLSHRCYFCLLIMPQLFGSMPPNSIALAFGDVPLTNFFSILRFWLALSYLGALIYLYVNTLYKILTWSIHFNL